jgi:hypothetical protein
MAQYKTLEDLKSAYYGEAAEALNKASGAVVSTDTGVYNRVFGEKVWELLNKNAKTWAALPKKPLNSTGFRVESVIDQTLGTGGISEGAAIPTATKPSYEVASVSLKEIVSTFAISTRMDMLAEGGDDTFDVNQIRESKAKWFVKHMNAMLHTDLGTPAGNNLESIDRVISSGAEETAKYSAGEADIYGFDRSADAFFDAYVSQAAGVDRVLTEEMIKAAVSGIEEASGETPNLIITGTDTADKIDSLFKTNTRYMTVGRNAIVVGDDGVSTAAGNDVGLQVAAYNGIPVLRDTDVTKDTISRIYFVNTDYMYIGVRAPTMYQESSNVFEAGAMNRTGLFYFAGELICTNPKAQGKIVDLKLA